jgi:hypothetical protein
LVTSLNADGDTDGLVNPDFVGKDLGEDSNSIVGWYNVFEEFSIVLWNKENSLVIALLASDNFEATGIGVFLERE